MNIQNYGKVTTGKKNKFKRKLTGVIIIIVIILAGAFTIGILTNDGAEYQLRSSIIQENHALKEQISQLQNEVAALQNDISILQGQVSEKDALIAAIPTEEPAEESTASPTPAPSSQWNSSAPRTR